LRGMSEPVTIFGIDLAWGEQNPDGITILRFPEGLPGSLETVETRLTRSDRELLEQISDCESERILLALDAPTICRNKTGSRPVDKECTRRYRSFEAGCHPVNSRLCERPIRLAKSLLELGFELSAMSESKRSAIEVYPHPAMIRLFELDRTIKYKRGPVAERRKEFSRYQDRFRDFLSQEFPELMRSPGHLALLNEPWRKDIEDQVDSILCAVIGYWHLCHGGRKSEVLGDPKTGQIVIPHLRDFG
ncbi:MAG: DUF429 domain-containing protein, partial [Verrucomicrobiota bacterium]